MQRRLSREPCCNELAPGLWGGRRPRPRELPDGVTLVVDLTAEFREPAKVCSGRAYRCLPVLDASVPSADAFRGLVEEAANWPGGVHVHCALGHGRTGMFVAAVLIARGLAANVREAEALLRKARPGVRLKPAQRRFVAKLFGA